MGRVISGQKKINCSVINNSVQCENKTPATCRPVSINDLKRQCFKHNFEYLNKVRGPLLPVSGKGFISEILFSLRSTSESLEFREWTTNTVNYPFYFCTKARPAAMPSILLTSSLNRLQTWPHTERRAAMSFTNLWLRRGGNWQWSFSTAAPEKDWSGIDIHSSTWWNPPKSPAFIFTNSTFSLFYFCVLFFCFFLTFSKWSEANQEFHYVKRHFSARASVHQSVVRSEHGFLIATTSLVHIPVCGFPSTSFHNPETCRLWSALIADDKLGANASWNGDVSLDVNAPGSAVPFTPCQLRAAPAPPVLIGWVVRGVDGG